MNTQKRVLLFDDDTKFLVAICDDIRFSLIARNLQLDVVQDLEQLDLELRQSGEIVLAIIDLWIIDKRHNRPDHEAGDRALKRLRARWPAAYVIVLSSHLDPDARLRLADFKQLMLANKPIPTAELLSIMDKVLDTIHPR